VAALALRAAGVPGHSHGAAGVPGHSHGRSPVIGGR